MVCIGRYVCTRITYRLPRKTAQSLLHQNRFVAHVTVTDDDGGDNGRVMCWLDTEDPDSKTERRATGLTGPPRSDTRASEIRGSEGMKSVTGLPGDTEMERRPTSDGLSRPSFSPAADAASSTSDRIQSGDAVTTAAAAAFDLVWLFEDEYRIQLTINSTTTTSDDVEHRLTVTCRDHGFPVALTSSATVRVTVRYDYSLPDLIPDVGASPPGNLRPRFLFPAAGNDTVHVTAGLPVGHVIAVVRAAAGAGDDASSLRYELVDGNGSAYFDLDRSSGHVIVATPLPTDNATLTLIVGVGAYGGGNDNNVSVFSLAELYVVVVVARSADSPFPVGSGWSWLLVDRKWWSVALVVVVGGASLVLGAVLFAVILLVCRKSRRGDWRRRRRRKLTSSYHVAVEFTASDDGLNNVAMATASHLAPAASLIGFLSYLLFIYDLYEIL